MLINQDNQYTLFLRHNSDNAWYNNFIGDYMNDIDRLRLCCICKSYILIVLYLIQTTFHAGHQRYIHENLLVVRFEPKKINVATLNNVGIIDQVGLQYNLLVRHYACLSNYAVRKLVVLERPFNDVGVFRSDVYFHPNIGEDGWAGFRQDWKAMMDEDFADYPCPAAPRFWTDPVMGSRTGLWPPSIFTQWVEMAKEGQTISLDPGHSGVGEPSSSPVAGPSGLGQRSPSPSSSLSYVSPSPSSAHLSSHHSSPPFPSSPMLPTANRLPSPPPPSSPILNPVPWLLSLPPLSSPMVPTAHQLPLPPPLSPPTMPTTHLPLSSPPPSPPIMPTTENPLPSAAPPPPAKLPSPPPPAKLPSPPPADMPTAQLLSFPSPSAPALAPPTAPVTAPGPHNSPTTTDDEDDDMWKAMGDIPYELAGGAD
jgi:hypothetical protein